MEKAADDRSIAELLAELAGEATTLVRREFELARAEVAQNASGLVHGAIALGIGSMMAILGGQALIAAAILVLARWMDGWVATLIVGGAIFTVGAALMAIGWRRLDLRNLTPRRTLTTLRQDRDWAKEQFNGQG